MINYIIELWIDDEVNTIKARIEKYIIEGDKEKEVEDIANLGIVGVDLEALSIILTAISALILYTTKKVMEDDKGS